MPEFYHKHMSRLQSKYSDRWSNIDIHLIHGGPTAEILHLCATLDEEKNGYVARDQLLYAL